MVLSVLLRVGGGVVDLWGIGRCAVRKNAENLRMSWLFRIFARRYCEHRVVRRWGDGCGEGVGETWYCFEK